VNQPGIETVPHVGVALCGFRRHLEPRVVSAEVGQAVASRLVQEAHLFKERKKREGSAKI
jgi:hypothetical protein